jgi:hypothetical protein
MIKSRVSVLFLLLLSGFYVSCEQYNVAAPPCTSYWSVQNNQGINTGVSGGSLIFSGVTVNNGIAAQTTYRDTLYGNFVLVAELDNFTPGTGNGAFIQIAAYAPGGPPGNVVTLGMGTTTSQGNGMQFNGIINPTGSNPTELSDFTSTANGILRIWRTGANIQIYAYNAADTLIFDTDFGTLPMVFDIRFGSNNETISGSPSAAIRQVIVNRDGQITSDAFNCNSLTQ